MKKTITVQQAIEEYSQEPEVAEQVLGMFKHKITSEVEGALRKIEGAWQKKGIKLRITIASMNIELILEKVGTECTHPTKSPVKKDAGEGETNYFICDNCKKPC